MNFIAGEFIMENRNDKTEEILEILDACYGVTKEGFYHRELWQLLVAIMLSAQSTDKQVDKVLPGLYERFPTLDSVARAPAADIEEGSVPSDFIKIKPKILKNAVSRF